MTVQALHRPPPKALLRMVQERRWAPLLAALEHGAPAHAVVGERRLNLFEEFLREAAREATDPPSDPALATATATLRQAAFAAFVAAWKGNDPDRPTPLTLATLLGRPEWVRALLAAGHDPNEPGEGHSPLTALARRHLQGAVSIEALRSRPETGWGEPRPQAHAQCLDALHDAGADLDRPAWKGGCPLLLACLAKDTPLVLALLARGANPEGAFAPDAPKLYRLAPLEAAIVAHNETAVAALLRAGANPWRPQSVLAQLPGAEVTMAELAGGMGQGGMLAAFARDLGSPHHPEMDKAWRCALLLGNLDAVDWFLDHGRSATAPDADGWPPLHLAAAHARGALIERLERAGASMDTPDGHGRTGWDHLRAHPQGMALRARLALRSAPPSTGNVLAWRPRAGQASGRDQNPLPK